MPSRSRYAIRQTSEKSPNNTGVVRTIALSDHWRWVSRPRCRRPSSKQNLRSHSEPLQSRQWGVGFFKDEVALELTPCHSPLKTFTLYNQVGHQTQGNVMGLHLGLRISRLLGRPRVACLTALEVELTLQYPDDLFDFLA